MFYDFLYQAEDGIRDGHVTGVQTCALPISNYLKTLSPEKRTTHCGGSFALRGLPWLLLTGLLGAAGFLFLPRLTVSKRDRKSVVWGKREERCGAQRRRDGECISMIRTGECA